jgi:hypothetical protein
MEKVQPGRYAATWSTPNEEEERNLSNGSVRNRLCCGDIQNYDNPTIYPFYP